MPRVRALLVVPAGCLVATCTSAGSAVGPKVATTATDSNCEVATTSLPVDRTTFAVTKQGPEVTEVYVYAAGDRGERENFGPGTTRDLAVTLDAGNYDVACKPKMTGDGIRTKITVTK